MKRNKLSGHGLTRISLGEKTHLRSSPKNGWKLECMCGFTQQGFDNRRDLEKAYKDHIQSSFPICNLCKEKRTVQQMSKSCDTLCKKCSTNKAKQWAIDNPNRWERQRRESHLRKKYGITISEYDDIVKSQNESCAICGGSLFDSRGFRPHVDHCHTTGKVRGVLCGDCNKALGMFKDDKNRIINAYKYLTKNESIEYKAAVCLFDSYRS